MAKKVLDIEKLKNYFNGISKNADVEYLYEVFNDKEYEDDLEHFLRRQWHELSDSHDSSSIKLDYILHKLNFDINTKKAERKAKSMKFLTLYSRIAAVLIIPLLIYSAFHFSNSINNEKTSWIVINSPSWSRVQFSLPDGSEGWLNSNSSLKYNDDFTADREVILNGEAFFDVETNPRKPFIVQLGKMTVYATGTKFNVFSYENEDRVETTLEEGQIHISIKGKENIDLISGQQIVYFPKTNETIVRDVPTETYTSWKENKLCFNDTPFEEVLRKISRRYNVVFEIRNRNLLDLKYTATFIDESIEDVMMLLKTVSPIKYTINRRSNINDKQYLKPKIIVESEKNFAVN